MPDLDLRDPLARALDRAMDGDESVLFGLLTRGSRLPGPRMNTALADAFANACRARGADADRVALAMAELSPEEAPGATAYEFLPVCGLLALGTRAAEELRARESHVATLHRYADDPRYRVRDAAVVGLSRAGASDGDGLVQLVEPWMDGYFHAAAVLHAMAVDPWLSSLHDSRRVTQRLDQAFELARLAPRAAARYPGHKELVSALSADPAAIAARFGQPIFELFERWVTTDDPVLRSALLHLLESRKLAGRFGHDIEHVRDALAATRAPPRNPDHDVGPTRRRGRRR